MPYTSFNLLILLAGFVLKVSVNNKRGIYIYITSYYFFKVGKTSHSLKTGNDCLFFERLRRETTYCCCCIVIQMKVMSCLSKPKNSTNGALFFGLKTAVDSHSVLTDFGVIRRQF
jgi:hypothetical protein